tara:strand:+ start:1366 stop:2238 length:873 start_codon:yes stop_codon:yes gene_type:complete
MSVELFKAVLPTVQNIFEDGKQQTFFIKEQIPFVEAQVTANIPTPESILHILPPLTTPSQFREIQAGFIQLKEDCKKVERLIERLIKQIDSVLAKLEKIDKIFGTIEGFISLLADLIPLFRTIIGVSQITLASQVSFAASGVVIIRVGDAIKFLKAKIKEINALRKITQPIVTPILRETNNLRNQILYPVRAKLQQILTEIRARCFYLDSVLIEKLKELELSMTQNPGSGGGLTGPQGTGVSQDTEQIVNLLASQMEPELILDNLENSNKQKVIEYLYEKGLTGYQIVRK